MFIPSEEAARGILRQGEVVYMCFVDLEKAFDRVPRKVLEWAKKFIPEVIVRVVMSLYEGAKTRDRVRLE